MVKKIKKYLKFVVCCALIMSLIAPSYAALSASDGSAFVTKAEFDSALADFNARLTTFEAGINSKIDSQVTSYLDRNGIWNKAVQELDYSYLSSNGGIGFVGSELLDRALGAPSAHMWYAYNNGTKAGVEPVLTSNSERIGYIKTKGRKWKRIIRNLNKSGLLYLVLDTPKTLPSYTTDTVNYNYCISLDSAAGPWRNTSTMFASTYRNTNWAQFLYLVNPKTQYGAGLYQWAVTRYIGTAPAKPDVEDEIAMIDMLSADILLNINVDSNGRYTRALGLIDKDPEARLATSVIADWETNTLTYGDYPPVFSFGPSTPVKQATKVYMGFVQQGDDVWFGAEMVLPQELVYIRADYNWGWIDFAKVVEAVVY